MFLQLTPLNRHHAIHLSVLLLMAIQMLVSCSPPEPDDSAEYRAFDKAVESGDFAEALVQAEAFREKFPELATGSLLVGSIHSELGESDKAIAAYRHATEMDPSLAIGHESLGLALSKKGKTLDAITSLEQAIALDPSLATAHSHLGNAWAKRGETEKALAAFRRAIELAPELAAAHYQLAVALIQQGEMEDAIASLLRTTELNPSHVAAFANLGVAYTRTADLDKAAEACRRAIELDPDFAAAHAVLGAALSMQGDAEKGIASLRRAIELDPKYPSAHSNLGHALMQLGKTEDAIPHFLQAIELEPENSYPYSNLAQAYSDLGQPDRSAVWLARFAMAQGERDQGTLMRQILVGFRQMKRELPAPEVPSDEAIEAYYQAHPHQFSDGPIHLRMISVDKAAAPPEFAETLRRRLNNGSNFALAAEAYSSDSSADEGGVRGWIKRGDLREDLEAAAFALEAGEFSEVIEDDTHYRILNVTERKDTTTPPLIEVRDQIIDILQAEARIALLQGWVQQAHKETAQAAQKNGSSR
ncbi:MAG: tetratricopeptide repeat protein [Verrucomicrobiae bacterium]|nr:tetratricopeptide repeat protein [Verrucomicrobiae bacterium]